MDNEMSITKKIALKNAKSLFVDKRKSDQMNCNMIKIIQDRTVMKLFRSRVFRTNRIFVSNYLNQYDGDKETLHFMRKEMTRYMCYYFKDRNTTMGDKKNALKLVLRMYLFC